MKKRLVFRIKIRHFFRLPKTDRRLKEGLVAFATEIFSKGLVAIHFGGPYTKIVFSVEEMPTVVPILRKHLEEFLPKNL